MLCYRCGSHNRDDRETCSSCGQPLDANQAASQLARHRGAGPTTTEGAPYRPGDIVALRFRVRDVLSAGPHGFLFRVEDVAAGGDLALKAVNPALFASPEERAEFARVIRLGRKLSHPNLVRVVEDGEDRGWPFFATPLVDGMSLRRIIDQRRQRNQVFSLAEIEPLIAQVALALAAAHKVAPHGAVKPENVIVQPDILKLTDFALLSALPRRAALEAQRGSGAEAYLAPEVLAGGPIEARTDVFALGVLMGELLTGKLPQGRSQPDLPTERTDLPAAIGAVYRKALSRSPSGRFATPTELASELTALCSRAPVAAAPRTHTGAEPARSSLAEEAPPVSEEHLVVRRPAPEPPDNATMPLDLSLLPGMLKKNDETQQMDPALIRQAIAAKVAASDSSSGPPAPALPQRFSPPPRVGEDPRTARQTALIPATPASYDQSPTMALPSFPVEYLERQPLFGSSAEPTSPRSPAVQWLAVLTGAALLLGTVGGYLLIQRLRSPEAQASQGMAERGGGPPTATASPAAAAARVAAPVNLTCPDGMRLVPAGPFQLGTAANDPMMGFDEKTLTQVEVAAFCIDEYEFPNKHRAAPRAQVTWVEAQQLCAAEGKRLCEETEWEKACKGPENRRFPYGQNFDASACNTETEAGDDRTLSYAGGFDRCRSGYGISDLSGNVAEWTASAYANGADKAVKGGAYDRPDYAARCSARRTGQPDTRSSEIGFRCCKEPGS